MRLHIPTLTKALSINVRFFLFKRNLPISTYNSYVFSWKFGPSVMYCHNGSWKRFLTTASVVIKKTK